MYIYIDVCVLVHIYIYTPNCHKPNEQDSSWRWLIACSGNPQALYVMDPLIGVNFHGQATKEVGRGGPKKWEFVARCPAIFGDFSNQNEDFSVILRIFLAHNNQAPAPWPNKSCVGLEIVQIDIGDSWNSLRYQQTNHVMGVPRNSHQTAGTSLRS